MFVTSTKRNECEAPKKEEKILYILMWGVCVSYMSLYISCENVDIYEICKYQIDGASYAWNKEEDVEALSKV